jgi:hypothetical protein
MEFRQIEGTHVIYVYTSPCFQALKLHVFVIREEVSRDAVPNRTCHNVCFATRTQFDNYSSIRNARFVTMGVFSFVPLSAAVSRAIDVVGADNTAPFHTCYINTE